MCETAVLSLRVATYVVVILFCTQHCSGKVGNGSCFFLALHNNSIIIIPPLFVFRCYVRRQGSCRCSQDRAAEVHVLKLLRNNVIFFFYNMVVQWPLTKVTGDVQNSLRPSQDKHRGESGLPLRCIILLYLTNKTHF